jgi:uncharacterized membrane protein YesL
MKQLFNLDNPVWRFIGNIADMFLLSVLWYLSCLPVFTVGCGTTAMYYVTLKMTRNLEGYTCRSFVQAFKANFKQAARLTLLFLAIGAMLAADLYWCLNSGDTSTVILLPTFGIAALLYLLNLAFLFPFLARCENTDKAILKMNFALSLRNFLPLLSVILVTAGIFGIGLFLFWPLLLIAPGLSAYLNSYLFNRIFDKHHLSLPPIYD